eukprot:GHVU01103675.1.p2 GENE.GHVU01103675.1~~GHVU01103675.1.p2  ORF type:complete len:132 (-),score=27.80 GHVU01103675.1:60-455(-)
MVVLRVKLSAVRKLKETLGQSRDVSAAVYDDDWLECDGQCNHNSAIRQPWFKKDSQLLQQSVERGGGGGGVSGVSGGDPNSHPRTGGGSSPWTAGIPWWGTGGSSANQGCFSLVGSLKSATENINNQSLGL